MLRQLQWLTLSSSYYDDYYRVAASSDSAKKNRDAQTHAPVLAAVISALNLSSKRNSGSESGVIVPSNAPNREWTI